jgi:hypothetical protein
VRRVVVALSVFALAVSGCGIGRPNSMDAARDAVRGAGPALRKAGSATVRFEVALANAAGSETVRWVGTTKSRYGERPAADTEFTVMTVRRSAGIGTSAETIDVDLRTITVGDVRYHRTPSLVTQPGRPWVRLVPQQWVSYGTRVADPDLGVIDPETYLRVLEEVSPAEAMLSDTEREEKVDGAHTRVYHIGCTLSTDACPTSSLGRVGRLFSGTHTVRLTIWVDRDGRPRRIEAGADLDTGRTAQGAKVFYALRAVLSVGDFGKPVEIAEPSSNEVTSEVKFVG